MRRCFLYAKIQSEGKSMKGGTYVSILEIIFSLCGIVGTSSIISGLVLGRIGKLERSLEKRDKDKVEENIARVDLLHACGNLAKANTAAIRVFTSAEEACETELTRYKEAEEAFEHLYRAKFAEYVINA